MAKKEKKEEVIDFTKPEKVTEEQLSKIQSIVDRIGYTPEELEKPIENGEVNKED